MESEGSTVLSDKCEGGGNSSKAESDENVQHEKKSSVRMLIFYFWMIYLIENVLEF
jgi:hypothetical protein